ncbi:hypothetical protein CBL_07360 [Carabus blaptoides fortunei]
MKFQFVFVSFLLCSLLGELFGEVVEDSTDAMLDTTDLVPERRASKYNSGCAKDPEGKTTVQSRIQEPVTSPIYVISKRRMPIQKVQVPQYRKDNYIKLPAYNPYNLPRAYDVKSSPTGYKYPRRDLRFQSNNDGRMGSNGIAPHCSNKVVQNHGTDGQLCKKLPKISNKKLTIEYLKYIERNKRARQVLRRMMDTDDADEEDQVEDYED